VLTEIVSSENLRNLKSCVGEKSSFYGFGNLTVPAIFVKKPVLLQIEGTSIGKGRVTKTLTGFSFKFQPQVETWWYTRGGIPREGC